MSVSEFDQAVFDWTNRVRLDPRCIIADLEHRISRFRGTQMELSTGVFLRYSSLFQID